MVREDWEGVPVTYYVPQGEKDKVPHTFGRTKEMLTFFSKRFGVRYPWAKYAQVVAHGFGGGMENTSATTMGDILQDGRSLLDNNAEWIVSHELAHQWWGDLVTCRDWAHLWLNEGFASYAEALWDEQARGVDAYAYNMYQKAGGAIEGGKNRPVVDHRYPNPNNMFDGRSYPKGAWILHMLRLELGEEAFWKGIQKWADGHRLQSVETADFRRTLEIESGRDLERFFHDWTERAGSPVVEVAAEYHADSKQAKIVVKQTQPGDPFQFPLKLVFRCASSSQPIEHRQIVSEKEATLFVALPGRPLRVDVDPDQAILGEIKEQKGRDLWLAQLEESPSVVLRIRAAKHFAESKSQEDSEVLARAMQSEKFWGVQSEIAHLLGTIRNSVCSEALLAGVKNDQAKIRRACVSELGRMPKDPKVTAAIKNIIKHGDPSYGVEAGALIAYAALQESDTVAVLLPWLAKPSHRDELRLAALRGLGDSRDASAVDVLLAWSKAGKPRRARSAALAAVMSLAKNTKLSEEQRTAIAAVATDAIQNSDGRLRDQAIGAAKELGKSAESTLPALDALAKNDLQEPVRRAAKEAAEHIRSSAPNVQELFGENREK